MNSTEKKCPGAGNTGIKTSDGRAAIAHLNNITADISSSATSCEFAGISMEILKTRSVWVSWQYEQRENGSMGKVPYVGGSGVWAKTDDPSSWRVFAECEGQRDGVGRVLQPGEVTIDLDHVISPTGEVSEFAREVLKMFDGTYMEVSPSGEGIHVEFTVDPSRVPNRSGIWDASFYMHNDVAEVYVGGFTHRFMTFTGNAFGSHDGTTVMGLVDKTEEFVNFLLRYMRKPEHVISATVNATPITLEDGELVARASSSRNGTLFRALYQCDVETLRTIGGKYFHEDGRFDQSRADMALAGLLAFWTQCDPAQMERIFSASQLGRRDKWQSRADYRDRTIWRAIDGCARVYTARASRSREAAGLPTVEQTINEAGYWRKVNRDGTVGTFYPNALGKAVMYRNRACFIDGSPSVWTGSRWASGLNAFYWACAELDDESVQGNWQQAYAYASLYMEEKERRTFDKGVYVAFRNGVIDAKTGKAVTPTPDMLITNTLACDYNPNVSKRALEAAEHELSLLAQGKPDRIMTLKCMIGAAMTPSQVTRQTCVCVGEHEERDSLNGKSATGRIIRGVVGSQNVSSVRPENLNNPFTVSDIVDKLVVIAEEAKPTSFNTDGSMVLKAVISGDSVYADYKFGRGISFTPHVSVVVTMNGLPRYDLLDSGVKSRLNFVPFGATFDYSMTFMDDLLTTENVEAFAILGLEGLRYLIEHDGHYPQIEGIDKILRRVQRSSSVVSRWIYDEDISLDDILGHSKGYVYGRFKTWAQECNEDQLTQNRFGRDLNKDQTIIQMIQAKGYKRLADEVGDPKEGGKRCRVWRLAMDK